MVFRWRGASRLAMVLSLGLGGCAALPPGVFSTSPPQFQNGRLLNAPHDLPARAHVADVPFFPDDSHYCGPASLASVLVFSGVQTSPQQLLPQVFTPGLEGSLQFDLLGASRRAGRVAVVLPPQLGLLFAQVAAGFPVVVLQKVGLGPRDWHYAVLVGYDLQGDRVTLRSSTASDLQLSIEQFDRSWAAGGRWAFVALVPGKFPPDVSEREYLHAVAPLEGVAPESAHAAYTAALKQWPQSWIAMMGLGNLAYARKDYARAAIHFAQAARIQPDNGDPMNNLAQALLAAGDWKAAQGAIDVALRLGKPHPEIYRSTAVEIAKARAAALAE
ncbi:PA2778 family cysteine peptidase [Thiomonas bhubaneswarensis]|uniref:Peptidase C39 family/TPR repeat n=1 Tax=Thiomonas bhubaneswarensis TaxID=339866 RepID=A0A0K6I5Y4_9BURK|nr:PA2778 family cysteine peptidase [Thiomonas bhubaneswarensis]CUA98496.1 Peptidase C39 family/TPR repeat [Thiomonas bhubaneswarensis]